MEENTQGVLSLKQFDESFTGISGNSHKMWTMRVNGHKIEICDTPGGSYRISLERENKYSGNILIRTREHKYGKTPKTKNTAMSKALKTATKYYNLAKEKGDNLKPSPKIRSEQTNGKFESIRSTPDDQSDNKPQEREPEAYKPRVMIDSKDYFIWEMNIYFSNTDEVLTSHILAEDLKTALLKAEDEIPNDDDNIDRLTIKLSHELIM